MRGFGTSAETKQVFEIKDSLSLPQRKSVALAIFLEISNNFEAMQSNLFYRLFTNSGYSAEDIVSDIIGFYRVVEPGRRYIERCEPVSLEEARMIWDVFGPVGNNKNYTGGPFLYSLDKSLKRGGAACGKMPYFLETIRPAQKGVLFREAK